MPNTKKILLSIRNLKKYFPLGKRSIFQKNRFYVKANEDVSIDIYEGETFGLVGESGCGKSTLGRVILQLYDQTAGNTFFYGRKRSDVAPRYVMDTLVNAPKFVDKWKKLDEKAKQISAECDAAGEGATFEQLQNKNLALAEAHTAFIDATTILGGFTVLDNDKMMEGANVLLERHNIHVKMTALRHELTKVNAEIDFWKGKLTASLEDAKKSEKINEKIAKIEGKKLKIEDELKIDEDLRQKIRQKLINLKEQYKDNEEFQKFDEFIDDGVDLARLKYSEMRHLRNDLQIIFQDPYSSLNPRMTIAQIIEEGVVTHGYFKKGSASAQEYIMEMMRKCGLQDYMVHRYPHQFSGGQRQRISIARSLAVKPKFVVCDECVSALDVSIQSQIINLLQELKEKENLTYLFISHDLSVVRYISDRIGVMYLGNIVELASAEETFKDPRHPYTVALLSSIPTTDMDDLKKERILLEGNIPSPIMPPSGCKFHTRCFMATEKCKTVIPQFKEIEPNHFVACHYPEKKIADDGSYLIKLNKTERKSTRLDEIEVKNVVVEKAKKR